MNRQSHSLLSDIANMMEKSNHCYPVPPQKNLHTSYVGPRSNCKPCRTTYSGSPKPASSSGRLKIEEKLHGEWWKPTYSEASTTLPETNSAFTPENRPGRHRKFHLPTIHFQGRTLSFKGSVKHLEWLHVCWGKSQKDLTSFVASGPQDLIGSRSTSIKVLISYARKGGKHLRCFWLTTPIYIQLLILQNQTPKMHLPLKIACLLHSFWPWESNSYPFPLANGRIISLILWSLKNSMAVSVFHHKLPTL